MTPGTTVQRVPRQEPPRIPEDQLEQLREITIRQIREAQRRYGAR
jgi:hypothetical protein